MYYPVTAMKKIDFGLTGRETQNSMDYTKYEALAYGTDKGVQLAQLVEDHWNSWVVVVEQAPWLRNWKKSKLYNQAGLTPKGEPVDIPCAAIAATIFSIAVWGYGFDNWGRSSADMVRPSSKVMKGSKSNVAINVPMSYLLREQACKSVGVRTYFWDDKIYRGCGKFVPIEFGDLDRWLENLWLQV